MQRTYLAGALCGLLAVSLTASGCGPEDSASAKAPQGKSVTVARPWVKAVDEGMTAVFGTLRNTGDSAAELTSATSPASPTVMLHETEQQGDGGSKMREVSSMRVPAGGKRELEPGGDHIMLMGVDEPIEPGDRVNVTLVFADGSRASFTAPARSFSGAKESYAPEDS